MKKIKKRDSNVIVWNISNKNVTAGLWSLRAVWNKIENQRGYYDIL